MKLDGGSYEIYCPGASTERAPFTVTGETAQTSTDVADLLQQATVDYADYVDPQTGLLVEAVKPLVAAIKAGDLAAAQTAYAQARAQYERVEPVAESFGDLDPAIDARAGDVPAGRVDRVPPDRAGAVREEDHHGPGHVGRQAA